MIKHLEQKQLYYSDPENMEWRCKHHIIHAEWKGWTQVEPYWDAAEYQVRRKRKMLEYMVSRPEPVREPLEYEKDYLVPSPANRNLFIYSYWRGNKLDLELLKRGLIYLTEEDAIAATRAMIGLEPEGEE